MKQLCFDFPILAKWKFLESVVPRVAGTGMVSDACIGDMEADLEKLHKRKS